MFIDITGVFAPLPNGSTSGATVSITPITTTVPMRQPSICPGCGRCRECGQPAPIQPSPYYPHYPGFAPNIWPTTVC